MLELIELREGRQEDFKFITKTFTSGLYFGNDFFKEVPKEIFFNYFPILVNELLSVSSVKVACLKEDPDVILGYSLFRGSRLHWIYVKQAWRKNGISKLLVPLEINTCTYLTKVGKSLKPKEWIFNPFLIGEK
jgi:hypothetical protein